MGVNPFRRNEYWQVVDKIAHDFECSRARADDNPRSQLRYRDP
ncbi:Uncharacterised protein [Vibrio cholerae]|nr:Uncharacterised protein [Vibrio cholerae]